MEKRPYIISAELDILAEDEKSVIDGKNIEKFRESVDGDLRAMGKQTEWVDSSELQQGLKLLRSRTRLPIISLDDRYITDADAFLGISRGVDDELGDVGYVPRVGYRPINDQFDAIRIAGNEAIVVDDVVFTGEVLEWLEEELFRRRNIKIVGVIGGIAIGEGIRRLIDLGITVEAVRSFEDVEDEICERDLAVVPGSGRRNENGDFNALYFDPMYGRPDKWASIPIDDAKKFAADSYDRSAQIIRPGVKMKDIGRFKGLEAEAVAQAELASAARRFR